MVSKFLTETLVVLAVGLGISWLCVWLHEHDVCPIRSLKRLLGKLSVVGLCALALWVLPFVQYGSIKGGNGGTNNVQMVVGPGAGVLPLVGDPPVVDEWENFTPITSTNTTRTLDGDDFRRGFVLARVGTDEAHDFSPPPEATVCADWRGFGATEDWFYVTFTNWAFQVGTNEVNRLRIHSDGWVGMLGMPAPLAFWPLKTKLKIAPEENWHLIDDATGEPPVAPENGQDARCPSRFWHFVTPSNTLQVAWQNILLDGDTNAPVSVQAEFWPDGRFDFRYDLSRCGGLGEGGAITNVLVGAQLGGLEWATNAIPTNVTSLVFWPISPEDAYDPDADNDGLPTIDELFVYHTDPHNPDTDYDGLTDYEELFVHNTDPLNAYSTGGVYSDGFAIKIGGENPFSYPEGSTNTVLEHVFYSGTTNGVFAYPQSSDGMAVLRVSVSGSGTGDLVVGEQAVPLVAPPQMRSGPTVSPLTLLVQVVKGETYRLYRRGSEELNVALDSDDFAFGSLPSYAPVGYVNFPNTVATPPCIHDFNARRRRVSLPLSRDADAMTCTWNAGMSMDVTVSNIPPRAATITGNFSARSTSGITYELDHPDYLFGRKNYDQTVRFCPHPSEPDPDDPDPDPDPPWLESGEGGDSESNEGDDPGHWCCYWELCDWSCACGCGGNHGGEGGPDGSEDFDDDCPVHHVPYVECAHLHASDYTNALVNVEHLGGVLYIRDPPQYEQIVLEVPTQHHRCCPCPDHSTNYVGVAYKSSRLRLLDANGLAFRRSGTSCTVNLAGVYPSSEVGDATLAFVRNGEVYQQQNRTVLGVSIKGSAVDLAACNALNANFGYPMTVSTNLTHTTAPDMKLVTNVRLPGGNVHLELSDATAPFAVWYYDRRTCTFRKLLDTASTPVKDLSMAYWKALMKRAVDGSSNEMPIYVTSPAPGKVKLRFRYWNVVGGRFVQDEAVQTVTSVKPPLLADYNWDFSADAKDALAQGNGRTNYFWTNHDTWRGDDAFAPYSEGYHPWPMTLPENGADMVVNGRNDLVNLCPLAVDLSKFIHAWGTARVRYVFYTGSPGNVRFVPVRTKWNKLDGIVKEEQKTISGEDLHSTTLLATSIEGGRESGYVLPPELLSLGASGAGALAVEFAAEGLHTLRIAIEDAGSGDVLFDSPVSVRALDVHKMYRWLNFDGVLNVTTDPKYAERLSVLWPDSEHADANVVFVHGYNMHPSEAWDWSQAMFKRLRWSGMDAGFTAVLWRGNESQVWVPKIPFMDNANGYATPNYHQNVLNAFRTAGAFATDVNTKIPGARKYMIAHSLGNVLVSAARQFHGLQYDQYFMLNAAVALEAYDPVSGVTTNSWNDMTPVEWRPYTNSVRATHWYELFLSNPNDERRNLTWKGIFMDVDKTINFYSSMDEVVANGNDEVDDVLTRDFAWYNQELAKGSHLVSLNPQAGWKFSGHYVKEVLEGVQNGEQLYSYRKYTPEEAATIAGTNLMVRPFFKDFRDEQIYGEGGSAFLQANDMVRWYALSHGIPAESFAAGANPVPKWGKKRNIDMATDCNPKAQSANEGGSDPQEGNSESKIVNWTHSYFIGNSLFDTKKLYEKLVEKINPHKTR